MTQHNFPSDAQQEEDDEVQDAGANDSVGSLLADIANAISDALRMLMFADKRHWASDEFEQVRALEDALDEAKADFQELGPLLKGSVYYENDRRRTSPPNVTCKCFLGQGQDAATRAGSVSPCHLSRVGCAGDMIEY